MTHLKPFILIISALLMSYSLPSMAEGNAENGKRLFGEKPDKCLSCHADPQHFTRKDRAKDLQTLEKWVRQCDIRHNTSWFDEDVKDVVSYLNQTYYHYPTTEKQ